MLIERSRLRAQVTQQLEQFRGVLLIGPRQVGKTTLARTFVPSGSTNYFDLEDPVVAEPFRAPKDLLARLRGLVVIDEVQHAADIFPLLRVLMDREGAPAKFLLLGSASMRLLRQGVNPCSGASQSSKSAASRWKKLAPRRSGLCGGAAARRRPSWR
jgi:hypothetical protein